MLRDVVYRVLLFRCLIICITYSIYGVLSRDSASRWFGVQEEAVPLPQLFLSEHNISHKNATAGKRCN